MRGGGGRKSVSQLTTGRIAPSFYGGTVLAGILLPVGLALGRETLGAPDLVLLALIGLTSLVGDFYVKYCIVKAGVYVPLVGREGFRAGSRA